MAAGAGPVVVGGSGGMGARPATAGAVVAWGGAGGSGSPGAGAGGPRPRGWRAGKGLGRSSSL